MTRQESAVTEGTSGNMKLSCIGLVATATETDFHDHFNIWVRKVIKWSFGIATFSGFLLIFDDQPSTTFSPTRQDGKTGSALSQQ